MLNTVSSAGVILVTRARSCNPRRGMRATGRSPAEDTGGRTVGRTREINEVLAALAPGRVVTLLGPPGVGKTRVARDVVLAAITKGTEPFFCDLVEAESAEDVCATIARALEVDLATADTTAAMVITVGRALSTRPEALLVLDNFEHLAEPAADIVEALAERGTTIMVTSRQRLALDRETVYPLAPLALPEGTDLRRSDAVDLFIDRFLTHRPTYRFSDEELRAIADLVIALEGLPLAIVLSAARARPPLDSNLAQRVVDTQISLAGAIGASWDLLTPAERQVLAQSSVFRGGFDASAASAVVSLANGARGEVIPAVLLRLVEKSLINVTPQTSGSQRFSMLTSIREFAAARVPDPDQLARRHAQHYASECRAILALNGADVAATRSALSHETDNLTSAHKRLVERGNEPASVDVALALVAVLSGRLPFAKLLTVLDASVGACGEAMESPIAARALLARSRLLDQMGQSSEALSTAKLAREMADGHPLYTPEAWEATGRALLALGRWREAREALGRALAAYRELGAHALISPALVALGDTAFYEDDLPAAEATYAEAFEAAERVGGKAALGIAATRMAIVEMELGRSDAALEHYGRATAYLREAGDRAGEALATTYLAILEQDLGFLDVARARLETLIVTARELGNRRLQGIASLYLGAILVETGEIPEAKTTLAFAERSLGEVGVPAAEAYARAWSAVAWAQQGDVDRAAEILDRTRASLRAMKEQSFYSTAVELFAGHIDLAAALRADLAGDHVAGDAHRAAAKRRLEAAPLPEKTQSDVRIARRVLERALGVSERPPRPTAVEKTSQVERALVIERTGAWFRPPSGDAVDIAKRTPLRKLLSLLLQERLEHPGRLVSGTDLMKTAWAGSEDPAAVQNRLRVAIATLRKLGLGTLLFTRSGGYLLDPAWTVLPAG